uniref:Uncharacterized protein n=1 Tax=Echeneis naucrates TaxID=173247 RepID=A0A665U824_ECHNA
MVCMTGCHSLRGGFPLPQLYHSPICPFLFSSPLSNQVENTINLGPIVLLATPTAQLAFIVCNYFQEVRLTACIVAYVQTSLYIFAALHMCVGVQMSENQASWSRLSRKTWQKK